MVLDRPHPVIKDPYTDSSQPIFNTTLHKNNMFHKPRNPQTAKPVNRSSWLRKFFQIIYGPGPNGPGAAGSGPYDEAEISKKASVSWIY